MVRRVRPTPGSQLALTAMAHNLGPAVGALAGGDLERARRRPCAGGFHHSPARWCTPATADLTTRTRTSR